MGRSAGIALALIVLSAGLVCAEPADQPTPNSFYVNKVPTFVVGTAGDDRCDRAILAQVELVRGQLFPTAKVVTDDSIDPSLGASAWPPNPVLYGGSQVNSLLARLAPSLPFVIDGGRLELGGRRFVGDQYRLIAAVPGASGGVHGPSRPAFLVYAGTATPGIAEINAIHHGAEPILVADAFGRLVGGRWQMSPDGQFEAAVLGPTADRIAWRMSRRALETGPFGGRSALDVGFPASAPADDVAEGRIVDACVRGLTLAAGRMAIADAHDFHITVYVHDSPERKRSLTGMAGDGHALVSLATLHVLRFDTAPGGPMERLLAHEGAHVLAERYWGPAGTMLFGEGVAVWAADRYAGLSLDEWRRRLSGERPPVSTLMGRGLAALGERRAYPMAGLFVESCVRRVGIERLRDELFGAVPSAFDQRCRRAGTTPDELQALFWNSLGR